VTLVPVKERRGHMGADQFDLGDLAQGRSPGVQGCERERAAVPIQKRGIHVAVVARVAHGCIATDFKRTRAIDRFAVDLQPGAHVFGQLNHLWIEIAPTVLSEVQ
jgi:hypothetical protein